MRGAQAIELERDAIGVRRNIHELIHYFGFSVLSVPLRKLNGTLAHVKICNRRISRRIQGDAITDAQVGIGCVMRIRNQIVPSSSIEVGISQIAYALVRVSDMRISG